MNYVKGDVVELSSATTIQLQQYTLTIRPSGTIRREIGDDADASIKSIEKSVRDLMLISVRQQLCIASDIVQVYDEGGVEGLVEFCNKELSNGSTSKKIEKVNVRSNSKVSKVSKVKRRRKGSGD